MFRIEGQRAGGKISRVCVFLFIIFKRVVNSLKIGVRDSRFSADYKVTPVGERQWEPGDGIFHIRDISPDNPIATGQNFCQHPVVIGEYECQTIQLPAEPDGASVSPLLKFLDLFCLGKGERRKFMLLLLPAGDIALF